MKTACVVKAEVLRERSVCLRAVRVPVQINLFVLDAAPFCGAAQNGDYVPAAVTWPLAPGAVDARPRSVG